MDRIALGIVGAGRIGRMHAENISRHLPDFRIQIIADPGLDEAWARGLGAQAVTRQSDDVFADPTVEAVAIFASSTKHVELIEKAAAAGKQIFCEKPIAFDPVELARVADLIDAAGVRLMVGLNRRFDANFMRVREAVQSGRVGVPHIVRVTNRDPRRPELAYVRTSGGMFYDFAVHDFDLVRFITGDEVEEVYAAGAALVDPAIADVGDIDTALTTLKLRSGTLAVIDNSREAVYGYDQRVEVFGSKGAIEANNKAPTDTVLSTCDGVTRDKPLYSFVERYQEAYLRELQAFARCLRRREPVPVGVRDVRKAVRIAQAATASLAAKRAVRVLD